MPDDDPPGRSTRASRSRRSRRPGRRRRLLFVTGGTGFLGRHVVTGPASEGWQVIAPPSTGLDLRNPISVMDAITEWRPTAIIHTAYRRDDRPRTVDATRHVARAAAAVGARLVHLSSDAVFRGGMSRYVELDPPTPVNEYGRQKVDAELEVASHCPDAVIVRTSLLIGRDRIGAHEQAVLDAIQGRRPMTFFTDEIRCPVLVDDLAAAVTELAVRPEISGVLHLAGPDELSRAELARAVAERHRWDVNALRFGSLAESGLDRPGRVVLDSSVARSHGLVVRGPRSW
jgi:dTDP-4-dehydrorhamnose reductase